MKPEGLAGCHQTPSSRVGSGHETTAHTLLVTVCYNGGQVLDTAVTVSFPGPPFHFFLFLCRESLGLTLDSWQKFCAVWSHPGNFLCLEKIARVWSKCRQEKLARVWSKGNSGNSCISVVKWLQCSMGLMRSWWGIHCTHTTSLIPRPVRMGLGYQVSMSGEGWYKVLLRLTI